MHVEAEKDRVPVKLWTDGVLLEQEARQQIRNVASLPFIHKHIAIMPDVHRGIGATIGSVIPTKGAIIPAAVGVDIGCGMMAVGTNLTANDMPTSTRNLRLAIEAVVPNGFEPRHGSNGWGNDIPCLVSTIWKQELSAGYDSIIKLHPKIKGKSIEHLGTLGSGNHFVELCLDTEQAVWVMLHSGSRGVGNRIGQYFISMAKEDMRKHFVNLPNGDKDLSYLVEGTDHFNDYWMTLDWAQKFARLNREIMMKNVLEAIKTELGIEIPVSLTAINCHHNYAALENHFGANIYVTRKGAVRARVNDYGIIPGSMGAKSFIVKGKGNPESFMSCSHGAGRVMSRTKAKATISLERHRESLKDVECRKDASTLDEGMDAYKDIDAVMAAQSDLVEVVATLKQFLCVKGS